MASKKIFKQLKSSLTSWRWGNKGIGDTFWVLTFSNISLTFCSHFYIPLMSHLLEISCSLFLPNHAPFFFTFSFLFPPPLCFPTQNQLLMSVFPSAQAHFHLLFLQKHLAPSNINESFLFFFSFFLGGAHPWHMEIPRLGVQLEQ